MPGVNVGRVGNFDPTDIAASGAPGIRCTYHADVDVAHGRAWLTDLHARNISVLMLLDNDAHLWESASDPWRDGVARARDTYGDLVDAWQVCNESDAGWYPGTTATIEERAVAHPSSWVMDQDELSEHLRVAREVLGPNAVIIGPGLVSGHPEWAADVDWSPVDMIACHPYAKEPGSASLMALLAAYSAFGWPVTVTEYDATTKAMHTWMARNMSGAYAFCWSDAMVPGFGLIERPAAYAEFVAANRLEEPMPAKKFTVGPGVLEQMKQSGDEPATDEIYHPITAASGKHQYSETFGKSGTRYVYVFDTNTTYRFSPTR